MLGLWYYFWNPADWTLNVTGTADVKLRGIQCSAVVTAPETLPLAGGWPEYSRHLGEKHWSAPKPKKPQAVPEIQLPVPVTLPASVTGTVVCQQGHGEVAAEATQTIVGRARSSQRRQQARAVAEMSIAGLAEARQRQPAVSADGDMIDQELEMLLALIIAA